MFRGEKMENIPITQDLQQSFNYIKANSLIKKRQKSSRNIEEVMYDRKKSKMADEKENDVWNQMSSLSECTSDAVASLAVSVDQAQERKLLAAQATIEITRMWNALYFSRCYQLEWSTKSQELEEIENKRTARHARKMITQRKGVCFFINER